MTIHVTVWNENVHETLGTPASIASDYPEGIHGAIAAGLRKYLDDDAVIRTATLQDPEHGLTHAVLDETDVLLWWGHKAHGEVSDEIVERVRQRVLSGMGLLVLHSGHFSKIFKQLMGTTCSLKWRNDGERELVWTVAPSHEIASGIPHPINIPHQEMYGEFFDVPAPDEVVFISSFEGGEVFRSGVTYQRGAGRIFYFSPGDQDYPVYHQDEIQRVLANGVRWAVPKVEAALPAVTNPARDWFLESTES
ncbi:ThuA domain-containing protein [Arthrobacter glacialis]|uniref:Trehalose utilization protein ThuA n=1 Tax=Arthrobacter glacialis TaxID=1664 RepID=A0A2S3ZV72_ARTGL|nr:ThuA domain-containing protein [Arthrobacter glacialis]POH73128.1 trehalose utilization protein ThuA [Arthrobacter glacialis]